ncbi:hypothetical protein C3K47_08125 [Solitalea longa]|uniref:Chromosome segregation protein SMC n=1 Tax=Solitalea longa TaxID=2079460 RepID=A0A2S5A387_9SPHI|nr:hypothetical protein [Solitalea longa]POY37015.1 hypothetical protein C3K47_08125 [Solitalea longa]
MEDTMTTDESKSKNWIYILAGIIVLLLGANAYLWLNKNEKEAKLITITDEKLSLQLELEKLKTELNSVKSSNQTLTADLETKEKELTSKIEELEVALRNGKLSAAQLSKTKKEIATLKETINQYLAEIETLKQEKEQLTAENTTLKTNVEESNKKNADLSSQNTELSNKVTLASMLKASSVTAKTFKRKNSGKFIDNVKAKNIDKLVAEFAVAPNELAQEGPYMVFMQIVDPSGKTISSTSASEAPKDLVIGGEKVEYTTSTTMVYAKNNPNYAIEWLNSEGWAAGTYTVNLFTEGSKLGTSTFMLK